MRRRFALALLLLPLGAAGAELPPEPDGYRLDDYRSPTPETVAGRPALATDEAKLLWEKRVAIFIDVLPAPRRPPGLPASSLWAPKPHRAIPGSVWLSDIGRGELSPEREAWFRANLARLTHGDPETVLVFYCLLDCWMSWNATKRALSWGYVGAAWYNEGTDGWEAAGLPLAEIAPPEDEPR